MEHHALRRPHLERHLQRRLHQLDGLPRAQRPAHHLAAEHVQHRCQVHKPFQGRHIRDVSHPQPVRLGRLETPLDPVRRHGRFPLPARRAAPLPPRHALQPQRPHQPRHPRPRHAHALRLQLRVHPPRPVGLPRFHVDRRDPPAQRLALLRPPARRPLPPCVVPAGGDPQHTAHAGDRILPLVRSDESEHPYGIESVSRANQVAAFDRISRSIFSRRFSRRRRTSSSRSALRRPSCRLP